MLATESALRDGKNILNLAEIKSINNYNFSYILKPHLFETYHLANFASILSWPVQIYSIYLRSLFLSFIFIILASFCQYIRNKLLLFYVLHNFLLPFLSTITIFSSCLFHVFCMFSFSCHLFVEYLF